MRKITLLLLLISCAAGAGVPVTDIDADGLSTGYELRTGLVPITPDFDGDRLSDGRETQLGTNPYKADTDKDGLPDGSEVKNPIFEGANPLHKDIFIEVDVAPGLTMPLDDLERLKKSFANAPVNNPDGTTGVRVHFRVSHEEMPRKISLDEYQNSVYSKTFDRQGQGYYHAVIVESITDYPSGVCCVQNNGFLVEKNKKDITGLVVMHELGHALGLTTEDYRGIDTKSVPYSEYPSVMNYNSISEGYGYSSEKGFDDWSAIIENLDKVDTSNL